MEQCFGASDSYPLEELVNTNGVDCLISYRFIRPIFHVLCDRLFGSCVRNLFEYGLFCLRGLQLSVTPASSIVAACEGHHQLTWRVIKHSEHMNTTCSIKGNTENVIGVSYFNKNFNHILRT